MGRDAGFGGAGLTSVAVGLGVGSGVGSEGAGGAVVADCLVAGRVMSRARRARAVAARRHSTLEPESNMALLRISAALS